MICFEFPTEGGDVSDDVLRLSLKTGGKISESKEDKEAGSRAGVDRRCR